MTSRSSSTFLCALTLSLATSSLLSQAQTTAPADISSSNAAPVAPAAPAPAPTTTPAPAPAPADTSATPTERPTTYTMQAGDSLDSIAKKFDTSIHAIAKLNKIPHSMYRKLRAGKVLQIPPAKTDAATK
jgi:LysM repeat protein